MSSPSGPRSLAAAAVFLLGCSPIPPSDCEGEECSGTTTSAAATTGGRDDATGSQESGDSESSEATSTTATNGSTGEGESGTTVEPTSTTEGCAAGSEGCACDSDGSCDDGLTCHDDVCTDFGALSPLPPTEEEFMWQNLQTELIYDNGTTCSGRVTIAMGDRAVCYVDGGNELVCAGSVFSSAWGPVFTATGQINVDQVSIRPTFNAENGNGMCLLADGTIRCMGRNNDFGVYGTGDTVDVPTLTQWGALNGLVRMGTGTWDQLCAIDGAGDVYCSGYDFGTTPTLQASGAATFWVSTFGQLFVDDADVWRPSAGRTECQVGATGLSCVGESFGPPGEVVDGTGVMGPFGPGFARCWLTVDGDVQCSGASQIEYFEEGRVLALASNDYTDSLCAVYDDGSLWCWGSNAAGKLGTGDMADVLIETEVAPAGSVRIDCEPS